MPRNDLTLTSKIALLDKIKSQPLNTSYRRLAEITGVPKSTISRVLRQESRLREEFALQEGSAGTSKRKRDGKDPDVEEALNQWFYIVSGRGVSINGPILKAKSEEFAKKLGRNDFKATDGWLSRWKARHNIRFKKAQAIKSKHEKLDEDDEPPVPITNQEAKKCMAVLQRYFTQEGNEGSPKSALNICADFVESKCHKNKTHYT